MEVDAPFFEALGISFLYDTYFDKHPFLLKVIEKAVRIIRKSREEE